MQLHVIVVPNNSITWFLDMCPCISLVITCNKCAEVYLRDKQKYLSKTHVDITWTRFQKIKIFSFGDKNLKHLQLFSPIYTYTCRNRRNDMLLARALHVNMSQGASNSHASFYKLKSDYGRWCFCLTYDEKRVWPGCWLFGVPPVVARIGEAHQE